MPLLAGAAGEAVDGTALAYLLHQSLAAKTKEEEARRQEEREDLVRGDQLDDEFDSLMAIGYVGCEEEEEGGGRGTCVDFESVLLSFLEA